MFNKILAFIKGNSKKNEKISESIEVKSESIEVKEAPLEIRQLKLGRGVYNYYRDNVKGNYNISPEQARLKLMRNVHLAKKGDAKKKNREFYTYGSLWILVVGDTIVWIKNQTDYKNNLYFQRDMELYNRLNKELGIK